MSNFVIYEGDEFTIFDPIDDGKSLLALMAVETGACGVWLAQVIERPHIFMESLDNGDTWSYVPTDWTSYCVCEAKATRLD